MLTFPALCRCAVKFFGCKGKKILLFSNLATCFFAFSYGHIKDLLPLLRDRP